jgi:cell surface protein SprA
MVRKNRTLLLSFSNNQLTETSIDAVTVGAGYHIKDVAFSVLFAGKQHDLKSDIVLQFNLTYNSNMTNIRKINSYNPAVGGQISSGSEIWMIELSGEYALTNSISVRAFFQTNINNPYIMNTYPNSTTKGGLMLRASF